MDVLLLDVTPLTLGIETEWRRDDALVDVHERASRKKERSFSTAHDGQSGHVRVFQGERKMATRYGCSEFNSTDSHPSPRGVANQSQI